MKIFGDGGFGAAVNGLGLMAWLFGEYTPEFLLMISSDSAVAFNDDAKVGLVRMP